MSPAFRVGPLGVALSLAMAQAHAAGCVNVGTINAQSGTASLAIAELYTAEGCDSCPPADKWFSGIGDRKGNAVPLAFHVDYWDGGGWKDRFAKPAFTVRQKESVVRLGSRTVVTPQLFVNGQSMNLGEDKRGPIQTRFNRRISELSSAPAKATLTLSASPKDDAVEVVLSTNVANAIQRGNTAAWLAVTENNLVSRVTAGENSGVMLYHDHVVRELIGPLKIADNNLQSIAIDKDWKRQDLSLVAFVQDRLTGDVLQAVSTPLCGH